jgi:phosphatidylglycerophosphate synthase
MPSNRRPLKVRDLAISNQVAKFLSQQNITPNQISVLSVLFAVLGGLCFWQIHSQTSHPFQESLYFVSVAGCIQLRLLCNLLDGMVAIEGGKTTQSGELYNDIPDRISDAIFFIMAGYAVNTVSWNKELGYLTAILVILTAYIRFLGASMKAPMNFQGPMAKQHRMAALTIASLMSAIEVFFFDAHYFLTFALILIALGSVLTCWNRIKAIYDFVEAQ